jgi:hypothetical protein
LSRDVEGEEKGSWESEQEKEKEAQEQEKVVGYD